MNTPVIYCLRNYFHVKKGLDPRFNNEGPERVLVETEEGKKLGTVVASTAKMVELTAEDSPKILANKDSIEMPTFTTLVESLVTLPELDRRQIMVAQRRDWEGNLWVFVPGFVIGYRTKVSPEGIPISKVDVVRPDFRASIKESLKKLSEEVYFQEKPEQKYLDFAIQQRKKGLAKKREKRRVRARRLIKGKRPSQETTQLALPRLSS